VARSAVPEMIKVIQINRQMNYNDDVTLILVEDSWAVSMPYVPRRLLEFL
jgi:hypothetical protein